MSDNFRSRILTPILFGLVLFLMVTQGGCRAMFNAKPIPGVPQPEDRIEQIRQLGKEAGNVSKEMQPQYADTLAAIIQNDKDSVMRTEAVLAIAHYPVPKTVEALRFAKKDPVVDVRLAVCSAWKTYVGDEAVLEVIDILGTDSDLDVRHEAIDVLGELKDERAVAALEVPLSDTDPALKYYSVQALQKITGLTMTDAKEWLAYCRERRPETAVAQKDEAAPKEGPALPFLNPKEVLSNFRQPGASE